MLAVSSEGEEAFVADLAVVGLEVVSAVLDLHLRDELYARVGELVLVELRFTFQTLVSLITKSAILEIGFYATIVGEVVSVLHITVKTIVVFGTS